MSSSKCLEKKLFCIYFTKVNRIIMKNSQEINSRCPELSHIFKKNYNERCKTNYSLLMVMIFRNEKYCYLLLQVKVCIGFSNRDLSTLMFYCGRTVKAIIELSMIKHSVHITFMGKYTK